MKIKIITVVMLFFLILSSFNVHSEEVDDSNDVLLCSESTIISCSDEIIQETVSDEYVKLEIENTNSYLYEEGMPMLPAITKTYSLPFGSKIKDVVCTVGEVKELSISKKILPCSTAQAKSSLIKKVENEINEEFYQSNDFYPNNWYDYKVTGGYGENGLCVYVTVTTYPVRYNPNKNTIHQISDFDIELIYEEGDNPESSAAQYDLVIITPAVFSGLLTPFVEHKQNYGVRTLVKTVEDIYTEGFLAEYDEIGRDKAENIKYFIKHAIETYNIEYVLLLGGLKGQKWPAIEIPSKGAYTVGSNWYVPVRYSNNPDLFEEAYITDLYYADIYDGVGDFSSWDSNGNGLYGEYTDNKTDYVPDVKVGRLPCRNINQVLTVLQKIIDYEQNTFDSEWFTRTAVFGGDTFPPDHEGEFGFYEGELVTNVTANYMEDAGFNVSRIWASNGNLKDVAGIVQVFDNGSGFMHFTGHANPTTWSTHPPDNHSWLIDFLRMDMALLDNIDKLPIVVIGGCHNNQFDVSLSNMVRGILKYGLIKYFKQRDPVGRFWYMEWVNDCWSEHLLTRKNGGSVATIGNTALGLEYPNAECTTGLSGWIESRFFYEYSQNNMDKLGDAHSGAIKSYIQIIQNIPNSADNRKTIEQFILFGDPSMQIGGYPSII